MAQAFCLLYDYDPAEALQLQLPPKAQVFATALVPAVGSSILTSVITESWPIKGEPDEVRRRKIAHLAASFTASGFIGLTTLLILLKAWR